MSISDNLALTFALDTATAHIDNQQFGHAYQVMKNFHECYPANRALDLCTSPDVADDINDLLYHFEALEIDLLGVREDAIHILMSMALDDKFSAA